MTKTTTFKVEETHKHKVRIETTIEEGTSKESHTTEVDKDVAMLLAIDLQIACTGLGKGEVAVHLSDKP